MPHEVDPVPDIQRGLHLDPGHDRMSEVIGHFPNFLSDI